MGNKTKFILGGSVFALIVGIIVFVTSMLSSNDSGYRTVLQYPNGAMEVRFDAGWYIKWFAKETVYSDYLTYDFSAVDGRCDFEQSDGVRVRYQDGGEGSVCGLARVMLPTDEASMLVLHKTYRSEQGVRAKLLDQKFPKALNLTAALMTSEEGYATKRSEFIRMAKEQSIKGSYKTKLVEVQKIVGVDDEGKDEIQITEVPKIILNNGIPVTNGSEFSDIGLKVVQFDLKGWDFEEKTLKQISDKRSAEMAIVTAKANAKKAYWQKEQVIADGEKDVAKAEYKEREIAAKEIVAANKESEKAEIKAQQQVKVNKQQKLAAAEDLETAKLQAKAVLERSQADAKAKEMLMEADGALQQKLDAYVKVNAKYAEEFGKQKWVSEITMGGNPNGDANAAESLLQMLQAKTAKDLSLSLGVK